MLENSIPLFLKIYIYIYIYFILYILYTYYIYYVYKYIYYIHIYIYIYVFFSFDDSNCMYAKTFHFNPHFCFVLFIAFILFVFNYRISTLYFLIDSILWWYSSAFTLVFECIGNTPFVVVVVVVFHFYFHFYFLIFIGV